MDFGQRFRINAPKVIFEAFDDEVVLINLDNGNYYSLNREGVAVWSLIQQGATCGEIEGLLAVRYPSAREAIAGATSDFFTQLQEEDLIVSDERPDGATEAYFSLPSAAEPTETFVAPILSRYTDMQELLLLDPIHDVDETGWPAAR